LNNELSWDMSLLVRSLQYLTTFRLFQRADGPSSDWQIIVWWEVRRIPYNLLVGSAGIVSSLLCVASSLVGEKYLGEPIGLPDPPLFAIFAAIAYGIMANVCFAGGWIAEIAALKVWKDEAQHFGPISHTLGVIFSVALTLLPGILIMGILGIHLYIRYFHAQ
jgi:hypothetical protein